MVLCVNLINNIYLECSYYFINSEHCLYFILYSEKLYADAERLQGGVCSSYSFRFGAAKYAFTGFILMTYKLKKIAYVFLGLQKQMHCSRIMRKLVVYKCENKCTDQLCNNKRL